MHTDDILNRPDVEDIRAKVMARITRRQPNECWPWMGTLDNNGYGLLPVSGKNQRAHRLSYLFHRGPIGAYSPTRSLSVCHTCDNPICCNPAHLFVGTDRDNVHDMAAKGRIQHGVKHYATTLTEDTVRAIRRDSRGIREVAKVYGVSSGTVSCINRYKTWAHVDPGMQAELAEYRCVNAPTRPPKPPKEKMPRKIRRSKFSDELIIAVREDPGILRVVADKYGIGMSAAHAMRTGKIGPYIPLDPNRKRIPVGRPRGVAAAPLRGSLYRLRRAVETVLACREEMDEGWFVPTEVMAELDKLVLKR